MVFQISVFSKFDVDACKYYLKIQILLFVSVFSILMGQVQGYYSGSPEVGLFCCFLTCLSSGSALLISQPIVTARC